MSNHSKHTPGPWFHRRMNNGACTEIYINEPTFKRIGVIYGTHHVDHKTEKHDAQLAASAPVLLKELIGIYHNDITDGASDSYGAVSLSRARSERIKAIIKSAGGEVYEP